MTAKEYLSQLELVRVNIRVTEERKRYFEELATKCTANYGMSSGHGASGEGKVSRGGGEAADMAREMQRRIEQYLALEKEIKAAIASVANPKLRTLLECRYIACWPLSRVADEMGYDYDYIRKLHGKALRLVRVPQNKRDR